MKKAGVGLMADMPITTDLNGFFWRKIHAIKKMLHNYTSCTFRS